MVRIKVFRLSQLLYGVLVAMLVIAAIVLLARAGMFGSAQAGAADARYVSPATAAPPGPGVTATPIKASPSPAAAPEKTPVPTAVPRASRSQDAPFSSETLSKPLASWLSRALIGVDLTDPEAVAQSALSYAADEAALPALALMPDAEPEENELLDEGIDVELVIPPAPLRPSAPSVPAGRPLRVLIYHTHTYEAYRQTDDDSYIETGGKWRTDDYSHSIVRLGDELARLLSARGMEVVHDKTNHEPPKLGTAYVRSLETLERYEERGEVFDLYIDLHRDAYVEGRKQTVTVDGRECARLMMLIGNGEGSAGSGGFKLKPDWQKNYALASAVTERLNRAAGDLCRPVMVKTGRYNQHISTRAILVEVGNNENTLRQCLNVMPYLADALSAALAAYGPDDRAARQGK